MINDIQTHLQSVLSKLYNQYHNNQAIFHFSVSTVFASILYSHGKRVVIVGGQAATYWTHTTQSEDCDLIAIDDDIKDILLKIGCEQGSYPFRFLHKKYDLHLDCLKDVIKIADSIIPHDLAITEILIEDITDPFVRDLMPGPCLILRPELVFINYLSASIKDDLWFDHANDGIEANNRAKVIFDLYKTDILENIYNFYPHLKLRQPIKDVLKSDFHIDYP